MMMLTEEGILMDRIGNIGFGWWDWLRREYIGASWRIVRLLKTHLEKCWH